MNAFGSGATPAASFAIRKAVASDLDDLVALENLCFDSDRLSRRSFRKLIGSPTAACIVAVDGGRLVGYALLLVRQGTGLARLYSIAVAPDRRGGGIARTLLEQAETSAFDLDRVLLRLEVRDDNETAIRLYERLGYRRIGRYLSYYEDATDAIRFEKWLRGPNRPSTTVPYYEQTTDFTCGPCCLLMAIKYFRPDFEIGPMQEIRLWRESTSVFMMSGTGGCDPHGLAVAAAQNGIAAEVYVTHLGPLFLDSVRSAEKRRVMELAQEDFRNQADELQVPLRNEPLSLDGLRRVLAEGAVAVVLVSAFQMFRKKVPHWILVVGDDGRHMVIHDPWVEDRELETHVDAANLPIPYAEFERMARYGRQGLRAAVILKKR